MPERSPTPPGGTANDPGRLLDTARLLATRLERLSADSPWAHRASGLRGSLLRCLELPESGAGGENGQYLPALLARGFYILEQAAAEIPDPNRRP